MAVQYHFFIFVLMFLLTLLKGTLKGFSSYFVKPQHVHGNNCLFVTPFLFYQSLSQTISL